MPAGRLAKGTVIHSAGWPLPDSCYGGSWIYAQSDTRLSIGFVTALDGGPPGLDPYEMMQTWKTHPFVRPLLEGGTVIKAGHEDRARGRLVVAAEELRRRLPDPRRRGLAAQHRAAEGHPHGARSQGSSRARRSRTRSCAATCPRPRSPPTRTASRPPGSATSSGACATGARRSRRASPAGRSTPACSGSSAARSSRTRCRSTRTSPRCSKGQASAGRTFKPDGKLTFDKVTGVYQAGSTHEEHQPSHLKVADTNVCATRCAAEYGNPCERFCPAAVYEMVAAAGGGQAPADQLLELRALQDVRHPRSLRDHHVDGPAGCGRSALHELVAGDVLPRPDAVERLGSRADLREVAADAAEHDVPDDVAPCRAAACR